MSNCLHTHIGNFVGSVKSVFGLTPYDEVLEYCVSSECLSGDFISCLVNVVQFNPDTIYQFLSELFGNRFIHSQVRIHILVKTSRGNGVAVCLNLKKNLYEPECLASLVEVGCSSFRNTVTVSCDLKQLCFSYRIRTAGCHLSCLCCITMSKVDSCAVGDHNCFVEVFLLNILRIHQIHLIHSIDSLFDDSGKTDL